LYNRRHEKESPPSMSFLTKAINPCFNLPSAKLRLKLKSSGPSGICLHLQQGHPVFWLGAPLLLACIFMTISENRWKTCQKVNLAICLKNSLYFEVFLPSRFQRLVSNPG
jgi:hypothetical protein